MNPFALLSLLIAAGFPVVYSLQVRGGIGGGRTHRADKQSPGIGGGMSPAEAAALEAARQEGAAGAQSGSDDELGALLAALLQGRLDGARLTSADYGQQLAALEAGVQNFYDGFGYPAAPEAPATTTAELVQTGTGGPAPAPDTYSSPSGATVTDVSPGGIVVTAPASSGPTPGTGQGYSISSIDPYSGAPHFSVGLPSAGSPKVT